MQRRNFIKNTAGFGIAMVPFVKMPWANRPVNFSVNEWKLSGPPKPVFIYNNWSSYDELSDNIPLTEELAMKELNEVLRLKKKRRSNRLLLNGCFLV